MAGEPSYLEKLFGLKGRVAVVTGGMGQLGAQYAVALARAGARVAIYDLKKEPKAELKELARSDAARFFAVDVTDRRELEKATDDLEAAWGAPGILINNAAIDFPPSPSEDRTGAESLAQWEKVLQVNLTGVFLCCQVIGERMAKAGGGSIINIASTYGVVSPDQRIYAPPGKKARFVKPAVYGVSKAGVLNLTRYLATYWAERGVRVNALTLGGVFNLQDEWFVANYSQRTPLGRMAREDEYNGAILFLASEASSYMTGANLVIDGGWTAW